MLDTLIVTVDIPDDIVDLVLCDIQVFFGTHVDISTGRSHEEGITSITCFTIHSAFIQWLADQIKWGNVRRFEVR